MNEATRLFVREHAGDDVRQLALRGSKDADVDLPLALQQIQGWQTARRKLPSWAAVEGLLYPPHLSMEQCSSEATARYKAAVVEALVNNRQSLVSNRQPFVDHRQTLVDLTGGFGVDFAFLAPLFSERIYVEQQASLFAIASQNFSTLGLTAVTVNADAADYLKRIDKASLIFLDPARRDSRGGRTYGIADCQPNILEMKDELLAKSDFVMLKLSPMLDWRKAVSDLGQELVEQVHIVSVSNECKELLVVLSGKGSDAPCLCCVDDGQVERFRLSEDSSDSVGYADGDLRGRYLYEPNASLMKAGRFAELAVRYGVKPLARNSHLFVADEANAQFPGRRFRITAVSTLNKHALRQTVCPLRQANISVRNFPMGVDELRRRLKLREGGSNYVFATTLATGEKILIVATQ